MILFKLDTILVDDTRAHLNRKKREKKRKGRRNLDGLGFSKRLSSGTIFPALLNPPTSDHNPRPPRHQNKTNLKQEEKKRKKPNTKQTRNNFE